MPPSPTPPTHLTLRELYWCHALIQMFPGQSILLCDYTEITIMHAVPKYSLACKGLKAEWHISFLKSQGGIPETLYRERIMSVQLFWSICHASLL